MTPPTRFVPAACVSTLLLACGATSSSGATGTGNGDGGGPALDASGGPAGPGRDGSQADGAGADASAGVGADAGSRGPSDGSGDAHAPPPAPCGSAGVSCAVVQAVSSHMALPMRATDFAVDLDGDGRPDNQYGSILGALSTQGFDVQAMQDGAVASGNAIVLLDESSVDPTFASDPGAALGRVLRGENRSSPDYSGAGTFTVDATVPPGVYQGPIASGVFSSPAAPTVAAAPALAIPLVLFTETPLPIPLYAAHLTITNAGGRPASAQIHGAFKEADVQTKLFPAVAADLSATLAADAGTQSSKQIAQIFDVGNGSGGPCTNTDGTQSAPNDGVIGTCEVAGNALIQTLFAPDVQLFDAAGNYHPVPGGANKDSLSVGVGLTLAGAKF